MAGLPPRFLAALVLTLGLSAVSVSAQPAQGLQPDPSATHLDHSPPAPPSATVPPPTDEDRRAAFPHLEEGQHTVHDHSWHYLVLFDQLEWQTRADAVNLDSKAWVGGDVNRVWVRAEGESDAGRIDQAQIHVLYGHSVSRWWDLVAGVRQDFRPGTPQTWAAVGVQGLAPYWFDIEATAYVGEAGRTHVRLETEYELLLSNRLILQPLVEVEAFGKTIPEARVGAGLSRLESGVRLRYEFRRDFAPYLGLTWVWQFGGTADFAREDGNTAPSGRVAAGLRWFF